MILDPVAIPPFLRIDLNAFELRGGMFMPSARTVWTSSVSYTHLDVYKRQAQIGRFTNGEWEMCSRIGLDRKDKTEAETGTRK